MTVVHFPNKLLRLFETYPDSSELVNKNESQIIEILEEFLENSIDSNFNKAFSKFNEGNNGTETKENFIFLPNGIFFGSRFWSGINSHTFNSYIGKYFILGDTINLEYTKFDYYKNWEEIFCIDTKNKNLIINEEDFLDLC